MTLEEIEAVVVVVAVALAVAEIRCQAVQPEVEMIATTVADHIRAFSIFVSMILCNFLQSTWINAHAYELRIARRMKGPIFISKQLVVVNWYERRR